MQNNFPARISPCRLYLPLGFLVNNSHNNQFHWRPQSTLYFPDILLLRKTYDYFQFSRQDKMSNEQMSKVALAYISLYSRGLLAYCSLLALSAVYCNQYDTTMGTIAYWFSSFKSPQLYYQLAKLNKTWCFCFIVQYASPGLEIKQHIQIKFQLSLKILIG